MELKFKAFHATSPFFFNLFALVPLIVAALVAISRVDDYFHHWQDVVVGSVLGALQFDFVTLGFFIAYWSYRRYFPKLNSGGCDLSFYESSLAQSSIIKDDVASMNV